MAIQLSTTVRNARLDAIETAIGASPILLIYSGGQPASTQANPTGNVLATIALPSDWMANAAGGQKTMAGTWVDNSADAAGTAGHYRIVKADGVCHLQGSISATGGGGDMILDNVVLAAGQEFRVEAFSLTDNNA